MPIVERGGTSSAIVARPVGDRVAGLDVLRGLAALLVASQHRAGTLWPGYANYCNAIFRPGQFAVVMFFLCSGFIIPSALQRHGSLVRFWAARATRLLPAYLPLVAAALFLHYVAGIYPFHRPRLGDPVAATIANASMIAPFANQPDAIQVSWTLTFELGFYVVISILFMARSASPGVAAAFAGAASLIAAGASAMGDLPVAPLPLLLGLAVVWALRGADARRWPLAALAIPLLLVQLHSRHYYVFYADSLNALYFAVFFIGAAARPLILSSRWPRWLAVAMGASVVSVSIVSIHDGQPARIPTFVAAYVVFGLMLRCKRRSWPKLLLDLGAISYSLYLTHSLVYDLLGRTLVGVRATTLVFAGQLALAIAVAVASHRILEPRIRCGFTTIWHDLPVLRSHGRAREALLTPAVRVPSAAPSHSTASQAAGASG